MLQNFWLLSKRSVLVCFSYWANLNVLDLLPKKVFELRPPNMKVSAHNGLMIRELFVLFHSLPPSNFGAILLSQIFKETVKGTFQTFFMKLRRKFMSKFLHNLNGTWKFFNFLLFDLKLLTGKVIFKREWKTTFAIVWWSISIKLLL